MEVLSYFPSEIRSVILSFIPFTLEEIVEHRKCPTISDILDRSVVHLILRRATPAKNISRFPNLKVVKGDLRIHDHADLSLLNRLTDYHANLDSDELLFTEFFRSVSPDHFKRGSKTLSSSHYHFYFSNGHLNFGYEKEDVFRNDFRIIIERQLFDGITVSGYDLRKFNDLLNSIKGLKRVTVMPCSTLYSVNINNIWTQVEEVDFYEKNFNILYLLKMFQQRYLELPNIKLFNYPLSDSDRKLFPNLEYR